MNNLFDLQKKAFIDTENEIYIGTTLQDEKICLITHLGYFLWVLTILRVMNKLFVMFSNEKESENQKVNGATTNN